MAMTVRAGLARISSGLAMLAIMGAVGVAQVVGGGLAGEGVIARSARLSDLSGGDVTVGRIGEAESAPAQTNMALAQGALVRTGEKGQAEVEFEDGSVARLTPNSILGLEELRTDADGQGTMTVMRISRGLVYLEMRAAGAARFRVVAGADSFWPLENATVRVNLDAPPALIAVLDGRIHLEHEAAGARDAGGPLVPNGFKTEVRAGESLRSDPSDGTRYFLSESLATETWDQWNEERDQAAANAVEDATRVREGFAGQQGYGWSDLDKGGTWYQGDGQAAPVWQPGEAMVADFDPYGYGSWTYFPGAGYTWASGYRWGWTPFRCGQWRYWDGFGWGWQPDSFCGTSWRFGGRRINVFNAPRGYVPVGVPILPRPGVHPILPGRRPGERPPSVAWHRDGDGDRWLGGTLLRPVRSAGFGTTPHGGSALGASLRRDYPVDARTHAAVLGTVANEASPDRRPVGGTVQGWRTVSPRPDPLVNPVRGQWDRGQRRVPGVVPGGTVAGPAAAERIPVHRGTEGLQGRSMRATGQADAERSQPAGSRIERSQPVSGAGVARPQPPAMRSAPAYPAAPRFEQRMSAPPAAPARSAAPPAAQAPASPRK